ncbi:hypothetical protein Tcan_18290 [Toxocara canis]|uniref:Uncharacterized protein n=1 Tax=Toxocara canis TaxID=6265 RepID=A0A0B2VEX1_TOXCA|nr:hypothetical protein Tcan_18290 [Toxocara canis]
MQIFATGPDSPTLCQSKVSLNNFLAIAFDRLEEPLLVRCVNEVLKGGGELSDAEFIRRSQPVSISEDLMDDFAIIAQGPAKRNASKSSLRNLLKNFTGKKEKE